MTGYLIYNEFESKRNEWFINELIKYFQNYSIKLLLLIEEKISFNQEDEPSFFYDNKYLDNPSFVINRTNNYMLSSQFETLKIKVFNNSYVSKIANNKYLTYDVISSLNIKMLDTKLVKKDDILNKTYNFDSVDYRVVIKPIDEKGGKDVYLCNNKEELLINVAKINKEEFIIQKAASDLGKDLRVYILGNKIYKAMLRINKSGFISNFCLGNDAVVYELNNKEIEIVNKILSISNFDYVGIDFLFDSGEIVFNEIEDSVGARMLYSKTNLNVAKDYTKYVIEQL